MKKYKLRKKPHIYPGAPISTDPSGSYTGLVKEPGEKPVQDADDL